MIQLLNKTTFVAALFAIATGATAAETRRGVPTLPVVVQVVTAPAASAYDRLLIEDVRVSYDESSSYRGLKPQLLARLNAAVTEAIRAAVGDRFTIVSEPGPGVLLVRPAIVNVHAERKVKHFWSYTPFGFIKGRVDTAAGRDFVLESATVEVQLLDSVSERELAAAADLTADGTDETLSLRTLVAKVGEWTQRLVVQLGQRSSLTANAR